MNAITDGPTGRVAPEGLLAELVLHQRAPQRAAQVAEDGAPEIEVVHRRDAHAAGVIDRAAGDDGGLALQVESREAADRRGRGRLGGHGGSGGHGDGDGRRRADPSPWRRPQPAWLVCDPLLVAVLDGINIIE